MKVNEFLKNSKTLLREFKKIKAVIGNQSADLDSIASSISMSYFLTKKNCQEENNTYFFPIINSTKSIIQTKRECLYLFDNLSISLDDLIFLHDLVSENFNQIEDVILVDHNELDDTEKSLNFSNLVSAVVDHHLDKGYFPNVNPRLIDTTAGSNSTLIADLFIKSKIELDDSFSKLLLYPILVDTNNLTCRASKKDVEISKYLAQIGQTDCNKLYEKLEELKFSNDDQNESVNVILQKDYKQYDLNEKKWGMSSVSFCLKNWLSSDEEEKLSEINKFMNDKRMYFFAMLSCFKISNSSEFKRDFVLFGETKLIDLFESNFKDDQLRLIQVVNKTNYSYIVYDVQSVNLTRKYWQPSLESFLKSI